MYRTLSKHELLKVVRREFEIRFKGIEIPVLEVAFEPQDNLVSIFVCRDESTDAFTERLQMHKLLLRADQFFIFINTDLLMKLFFSSYRVNHDSVDFYGVSEFGLTEFVFPVSFKGKPLRIEVLAGNVMHAYVKALMEPKLGRLVSEMDISKIMSV